MVERLLVGATSTSSVVDGNVCFQAAAELTSTADMGARSRLSVFEPYMSAMGQDNVWGDEAGVDLAAAQGHVTDDFEVDATRTALQSSTTV